MLDNVVKDYAAYLKLDVSSEFKAVQDVIDNMLTRLEELTSVLQIIRIKNSECGSSVSEDISKYRSEVTTLSKKINVVNEVIVKLQNNVDLLENQVEKAELDFGVSNDNKLQSFLKPFLKRNKDVSTTGTTSIAPHKDIESVMQNFDHDS